MKMMNVSEAKAHFSSVVEQVISGENVCISKRNVPVAQIIPLSMESSRKRHHTRVGWAKQSGVAILGDLTEPVLPESEWDMLK
ncbi:MAG: type II toxin-antitoxin system prevent-host-death family antitoxin [Verrucomicrobia bacterium]|nr:type II toxin-antitoxin system prevent-host-death family antitoxin [Verrucomicrobiota bacterium]MCH8526168.1 type II toxin-antitoxin system prevent-host-death family antitoxin [Kiritimatiellia bacterium]